MKIIKVVYRFSDRLINENYLNERISEYHFNNKNIDQMTITQKVLLYHFYAKDIFHIVNETDHH